MDGGVGLNLLKILPCWPSMISFSTTIFSRCKYPERYSVPARNGHREQALAALLLPVENRLQHNLIWAAFHRVPLTMRYFHLSASLPQWSQFGFWSRATPASTSSLADQSPI